MATPLHVPPSALYNSLPRHHRAPAAQSVPSAALQHGSSSGSPTWSILVQNADQQPNSQRPAPLPPNYPRSITTVWLVHPYPKWGVHLRPPIRDVAAHRKRPEAARWGPPSSPGESGSNNRHSNGHPSAPKYLWPHVPAHQPVPTTRPTVHRQNPPSRAIYSYTGVRAPVL